ncbi:MAG: portal protein [Candidatus Endolissoclinum sp. TMED37]|nr:MAG: portal protein [Candidatus Endolissoclinum sp. TMED37]
MMEIFGFEITRKKPAATERSFVAPSDEGAIEQIRTGGYYGTYFDVEGVTNTEESLIKRYREISMMADVDSAIQDIVDESIANLDDEKPVEIDTDNLNQSAKVKQAIQEEFYTVLKLFDFNRRAQDYYRRWYIDGRIYFHKVIDTAKPKQGITDIRYIDPRKIRLVREVKKDKDPKTQVNFVKEVKEFFIYDEKGLATKPGQYKVGENSKALKITKDAVAYCPSGLVDQDKNLSLSYLHKAIRPANQLRMMENAVVIYRITRAPERRIFYVDTGNLPKLKAEQYLKDIMDRYRNKLVYDANTGEIRDDKKFMSMLEDFWMPRREGGRGTEIQTLPGGQNLGEMADVEYFQRKLYQSLNVPVSRLEQQAGLNFGRSAEISRDELKFTKFINKLRKRFSALFDDLLKTQLILKGIITEDDWNEIKDNIHYRFASDAYYAESKDQEILRSRIEVLNGMAQYVGQYYSKEYVQKEILRLSDEQISQIDKEINSEAENVEPQEYEEGEGQ